GFRGLLASDLPQGAGLSSSAALEVVGAWALSGGERPPVASMDLVHLVQRSENGYIGLNNGIMDQFASIFGEPGRALLLDCRTLEHRAIPLVGADLALVACHSGSPRRLEASAYNERRAQCEAAVAAIAALEPGVTALRDVTPAMLDAVRDRLDPVAARRAQHVVDEDRRVMAAIAAPLTFVPARRTWVPCRSEFGISATRSTRLTSSASRSVGALPSISSSTSIGPDTTGVPPYSLCAVTRTRRRSMESRAASRNRSLEKQAATARVSSWPPLNPRPRPPTSGARSTTRVNGPAEPSAVARPSTLMVSTS
ncbi:MAG TPA: hypothetical protein VIH37_00455, partial [Candidatus Limnocylindrales bacterium]